MTLATVDDEDGGRFTWDVYHIENYHLDPSLVLNVLKNTTLQDTGFRNESEVEGAFREIGKGQIDRLVEHSVKIKAHETIGQAIKLRSEKDDKDPAERVGSWLKAYIDRLTEITKGALCEDELKAVAAGRREVLEKNAVKDDGWKNEFRGRDLFK